MIDIQGFKIISARCSKKVSLSVHQTYSIYNLRSQLQEPDRAQSRVDSAHKVTVNFQRGSDTTARELALAACA